MSGHISCYSIVLPTSVLLKFRRVKPNMKRRLSVEVHPFFPGEISVKFLGAFTKSRKATLSFVMFVRPHGTTRLTLDGFSWNLIFENF